MDSKTLRKNVENMLSRDDFKETLKAATKLAKAMAKGKPPLEITSARRSANVGSECGGCLACLACPAPPAIEAGNLFAAFYVG
jgi:hypothetical protein